MIFLTVISISVPDKLLERVDATIKEMGFASRSEITRQALRFFLIEETKLIENDEAISATITIIYKGEGKRDQIFNIQHQYSNVISTFLHTHVEQYCLEVIVVKGPTKIVKKLVDALRSNENIIQIKIAVLTNPKLQW